MGGKRRDSVISSIRPEVESHLSPPLFTECGQLLCNLQRSKRWGGDLRPKKLLP